MDAPTRTAPPALLDELRRMGVTDERVIRAVEQIPRPDFVPPSRRKLSWENVPLPIGEGQTISQPFTVAYMLELAEIDTGSNVLEIGAGSGYVAALLALLAGSRGRVSAIELRPSLAARARQALTNLRPEILERSAPVEVICGDGKRGHAPLAPFDAIVCSAQTAEVPAKLPTQLAEGGSLVIPIQHANSATMTAYRRKRRTTEISEHGLFSFVPLV